MRWLMTTMFCLFALGCSNSPPAVEPLYSLGPRSYPGYLVRGGAGSSLPANAPYGFVVTANTQGDFRVSWIDQTTSLATFSGSITTEGAFTQVTERTGAENSQFTASNQLTFRSIPGAATHGVDLVLAPPVGQAGVIYVEGKVNDSTAGVGVYFTGGNTGRVTLSDYNPVAFSVK